MTNSNTSQFKLGGTLFETKAEQFILILPVFFFVGIGFDLIQSTQYSPQEKSLGLFVSQFIFLNHIHVFFTFFLTFSVPEVRQWLTEKRSHAPNLATLLGLFFISIYLYWAIAVPYLRKTSPDSAVIKASIIAVILIGTYHNFIQSLGLSLAYNRIIKAQIPNCVQMFDAGKATNVDSLGPSWLSHFSEMAFFCFSKISPAPYLWLYDGRSPR
ncbi:MAG: hypothetical protein IPJ84_05915 [Bdellovibrionales bacterium]|nr:hypothetical protein [Bdellovibrionales bacterium]